MQPIRFKNETKTTSQKQQMTNEQNKEILQLATIVNLLFNI